MTPSPIPQRKDPAREFGIAYALWLKENYPQEYAAMKRRRECITQAEAVWEERNELVNRKNGDDRVQPVIEEMACKAEALEAEARAIYNDPANWVGPEGWQV